MRPVLILRPQPGAAETAARAAAHGLDAAAAPLFEIVAKEWRAPDPFACDAIVLTSAQAARHAGPELGRLAHLPCYTVGPATADAARGAGLGSIRVGASDAQALADRMRADGIRRPLHLAGRDHRPWAGMTVDRRIVYAAEAVAALPPEASAALARGAVALLHSPRAARLFGQLADAAGLLRAEIRIAAISAAAAGAAGAGWRDVAVAAQPRDEPLLEVAVNLCQDGRRAGG